MIFRRWFQIHHQYPLKCGLEVHTQLKTKYKLFSLSPTSFNASPNTNISYFDMGIPGTQPQLNPEALLLALKLSVALDCKINHQSKFDRKHYFYLDQPLGYQITQYYNPLSKEGKFELNEEFDGVNKIINIEQIQLEQDTGKLNYNSFDNSTKLDLNRANTPLIELITKPDFTNWIEIRSFLKKYQTLVKHLGICTGDLETGAIRVDVNISINNGNRVEIKNLGSSGEIHDALEFEYNRQISQVQKGNIIEQETRGWSNGETKRLRSKENSKDYRYLPDSELPIINLHKDIGLQIRESLPELPDQILQKITSSPFNLELKHGRFLLDNISLLEFYLKACEMIEQDYKLVNNWIFQELLSVLNKKNQSIQDMNLQPEQLVSIITKVSNGEITSKSGKLILNEIIGSDRSIESIIKEKNLRIEKINDEEVTELCKKLITANPDVVEKIRNGKSQSINYLLGLGMKESKGKVSSKVLLEKLRLLI